MSARGGIGSDIGDGVLGTSSFVLAMLHYILCLCCLYQNALARRASALADWSGGAGEACFQPLSRDGRGGTAGSVLGSRRSGERRRGPELGARKEAGGANDAEVCGNPSVVCCSLKPR